jgi:plastocyanin
MFLNNLRLLPAIAAVVLATACGSKEPAAKTPPADAKRVDPATAGKLVGKVQFDGPVPANQPIKMSADPVCASENPNGATSQTYLVKDGGLDNVFVYVKDGLGNYYFDAPTEPVTLNQKACHYEPHVFGVRVGQPLDIVNDDSTLHNVHAMPTGNQEFNFPQQIKGMKNRKTFTTREVMVPFKCDVHGWMTAYAGVVDNPYYAVTTGGGRFELKNLPPGTYTVEAWHERLGTQIQQVTLGEKESKDVSFTFKPAAQ